ncbi:MAG: hypothetical protein V1766_10625 [Pseudomonadota bacterium]
MMKRRKSLMILAILVLGLFFIGGCGEEATNAPPLLHVEVTTNPSPASVGEGFYVNITATVTRVVNGTVTTTPAIGESVSFRIGANRSGATLSASSAVTSGAGIAGTVYYPGNINPTVSVQDTVYVTVGTASSAVSITRTGSSSSAFTIAVAAAPTTLTADNAHSVITANVKNNVGSVVSGVTVTFTVTGGGSVPAPGTATTDGDGNAVITFTGGGARPAGETDVVTASITVGVNTYTADVIITYP